MASVYKRHWITRKGQCKEAWVVTWVNRDGKQRRRQRATKRAADALRLRIENQLAGGASPGAADRAIIDIAAAWLLDFEGLVKAGKREESTLRMYRQHVGLHLQPFAITKVKAGELAGPDCLEYARALEVSRSDAMAHRVFGSFRQILSFGVANGWLTGNPANSITIRTAGERADEDDKVEIPPKEDLRRLLAAAARLDNQDNGRALAFVWLQMSGGLRMSEVRGFPIAAFNRKLGTVAVRQRADKWGKVGPVKSAKARRRITLAPAAVAAIARWVPHVPKGELGLLFPNGAGNVESYANLWHRLWCPLMVSAGLATVERNKTKEGERKIIRPNFGFHQLRHVAASLWIEQRAMPKQVQTWIGHANIQFTMDTYGHLWADPDSDRAIAAAAERSLLGKGR
jgi:integrase